MRRLVVGLAAVALLAGACGQADTAKTASGGTVTIGAVYPTSGGQGPGGRDEYEGAKMAIDLANQAGGVRGRKLELRLIDTPGPDAAPAAVERLHEQGVQLVLGSYGSVISEPAAAAASNRSMLFWETGAVGEQSDAAAGGERFFRMPPTGANLGRSGIAFARDVLTPRLGAAPRPGPLRYTVAYVDDPYGRAVGLAAIDEIKRSGLPLVGTFPYDFRTANYTELAAQIAATKPDVLYVSAYLADGVALRKATIDAHIPLMASVGTSSSYCMDDFMEQLGAGAVGLFASDKPGADNLNASALLPEGNAKLAWAKKTFDKRFHRSMEEAALAGFANTWALVGHVLPAAKGFDPQSVAAAALATKLPQGTLANGSGLDMADPGEPDAGINRAAVSVIWEWLSPTKQAVVWPPAFANQPVEIIPIAK